MAIKYFEEGEPLADYHGAIFNRVCEICPGPVQVICRYDGALPIQQFFQSSSSSKKGVLANDMSYLEPMLAKVDAKKKGWIDLASGDIVEGLPIEFQVFPESGAMCKAIIRELDLYSAGGFWKPKINSPTSRSTANSIIIRALKRFVQSPMVLDGNNPGLAAWCEVLQFILQEKLFAKNKWFGESRFEGCLKVCLAMLENLRDTHLGMAGRPLGMRRVPVELQRCSASPAEIKQRVNQLLVSRPGAFLDPSWEDYWRIFVGFAFPGPISAAWFLCKFSSGFLQYTEGQIMGYEFCTQSMAWAAFACFGGVTGLCLGMATEAAAEAVQSTQDRLLQSSYVLMGLDAFRVKDYTPGQIEVQMAFKLREGKTDDMLLWTAYEYIRQTQHKELANPFQSKADALRALELSPDVDHSRFVIQSKRDALVKRKKNVAMYQRAYEQLSEYWLEEKYFLQKVVLGSGAFGKVFRGVRKSDQEVVAVKQVNGNRRIVLQEVYLIRAVDQHPNFLRLYDYFESGPTSYLVFEYCDGGDLEDAIRSRISSLEEALVAQWTREVVSAIAQLHALGICHRDIKPANFLLRQGTLKLADFGFAVRIFPGRKRTEYLGTPSYMAPEISSGKGYGFPVDLWAAGVILLQLLTRNMSRIPRLSELIPGFGFSPESSAFTRMLLKANPHERITAEEALRSDWLTMS